MGHERGRAIAVTREEFDDIMRRRNNGGGPGGSGEGPLAELWKRWAMTLVAEKRDALETRNDLSIEESLELNALKAEFDRVEGDAGAAYRAVKKYSPVLNNPIAKAIFG